MGFSPPTPTIFTLKPRHLRKSNCVGWASAHRFSSFSVVDWQAEARPAVTKIPSFPRRRESRPFGAETYRIKRFPLHPGFPLSWE
ncbi:hypothetical protein COH32_08940 [Neisseria meningitidis]|nr:hypothetical protein COI07_09265 [Neisseria meningitidis]RQL22649.1 hypothetical protein COH31_08990 [Neisseria meningitidis]RQL29557.1 hypothetical protein COH32_08940 [Neisseria meningitidis]RQL35523.1 hypothetical protein COH28_09630 [Neisseria meningitidis]